MVFYQVSHGNIPHRVCLISYHVIYMLVTKFKHLICIHVDKKAEQKFFDALQNLTSCFSNIFLAKKREDVIYGHYSRLQVKVQSSIKY